MAVTQIRGNTQIKAATVTEAELNASVAGNGISGGAGTALALDLNELTAAVVDVSADSVAIIDATDSSTKKEAIADIVTAIAGNGLSATAGVLALDLNEVTAAAIDVSADEFVFVDATDSSTKKESFADLATAQAGDGLSASSGQLALDLNELTAAIVDVAADSIAIVDANDLNASRKESIADLITAIAGDGLGATSGVLAVNVDDSTVEINADTVRVKAAGITDNELATNSVTNAKIADDAVDSAEIAGGAVDVDHLSDLRVTDDGVTSGSPQTVSVAAGFVRDDNTVNTFAGTTGLSVADNDTNFIEYDPDTNTVSANTTGFTSGRLPLAEVVVSAAPDITAVNDKRAWLDVEIGASGLTNSNFVDREDVAFDFDGIDTTGVLANTPVAGSEHVYLNGILQNEGGSDDYTISGATITFNNAPQSGDEVLVSYRK